MKKITSLIVLLVLSLSCHKSGYAQNIGALLPPLRLTFWNASGSAPNSNGFVCTTSSGTNTSRLTYQDAALTVANQNPIRLNAAGRAVNGNNEVSIYLQAASYRITVYAAGTSGLCAGTPVGAQIMQADGIYDLAQLASGGGWTYTPAVNYPVDEGRIYPSNLQTDNPRVIAGANSTDSALNQGQIIGINGVTAANNTVNAVLTRLQSFGGGGGYGSLVVDYSGNAGYKPLKVFTGGNEATLITTDPFLQLTTSYAAGNRCASGTVGLRNNAGAMEKCENGGAWTAVGGGGGGSGISGAGTAGYVAVFTAATAIGNSILFNASNQILLGGASTDVSGSNLFITIGNNSGVVVAGAATSASVLSLTVVNSTYTSIASNKTGNGSYLPLATFINGAEASRWTLSPFFQLTASYTGGTLSAAGTVALRNNAGTLEASQNGGAWAALGGGGGGGITGNGTTNFVPVFTGATAIGNSIILQSGLKILVNGASSDYSFGGSVFGFGGVSAVNNTVNATIATIQSFGGVNGEVVLASDKSGSNTFKPIGLYVNGSPGGSQAGDRVARWLTTGGDRTCLWINGSLRLLVENLNADGFFHVIDGGPCP